MEQFTLPATTYEPPSRLVRRLKLNTIMEDDFPYDEVTEERGRSRSPVDRSPNPPISPVPSSASTISSYYRNSRMSREFDDLYDISESESDPESIEVPDINIKRASMDSECSLKRNSWGPPRKNRYPSLVIPSPRHWPTIEKLKKNSPVPPTPPAKIPISPEVLSKLSIQPATSSAPPSLDGSLTSDQLANSTAPPTPDQFCNPANIVNWSHVEVARSVSDFAEEDCAAPIEITIDGDISRNSGIHLPAGALDILQHLSLEGAYEPSSDLEDDSTKEMQEVSHKLRRSHSSEFEPTSAVSEYSISQLSIPSPGGFFSTLEATSRNTWSFFGLNNDLQPSSATAEHFYNAPWNHSSSQIVEQVVNTKDNTTEGPITAVFVPFSPTSGEGRQLVQSSTASDVVADEIKTGEVLMSLDSELRISAETTFDRTTTWLAAQTSYMAALRETNPSNNLNDATVDVTRRVSEDSVDSTLKKAVKFLDTEVAKVAARSALSVSKADPLFYQAFQHMSNASSPTDSFIHRLERFDAVQALRASLEANHVDSLLGNYQTSDANRPAPQRPISMMPGKGDDEETPEQRVIAQVERERQALEQVRPAMWVIEAMRFLAGGRLLNSPAADVLSRARPLESCTLPEHVRVLDLGGQPQCDWAWHCARDYPNVKTYTATCDTRPINMNLRGPSNHRLLNVPNLWTLPFPANHFDVISARSLPLFLKTEKPLGANTDEYDLCLRECMRVLKPGGYLEFFILDSEILHAGSRGSAASVEFGFNLKARGYDAAPTKSWLARVRRAGLVDIKRAWMFMPMGAVREDLPKLPETPPPHVSMYEDQIQHLEAVHGPIGTTADAAHISGLVGSWLWEQWLLKLQMEMGKQTELVKDVGRIVEEGRGTGAGWRCMNGWAKKGF